MAATIRAAGGADDPITIWEPQPKQAAFITCPADDVGFGGARGGGKSDAVPADFADHEEKYGEAAIGIAVRRERTQLVELIERSRQILAPIGFKWHEQDKYFRGPKGGRLRFAYLERDADADAYQGHGYTRVYGEEIGTFPSEVPINKMMATLRSGHGVPCQFKATCNPGGPGHQWVKARYGLGGRINQVICRDFEFENPWTKKTIRKTRAFIPSLVTDNKYLGDDYVANLYQVGSKALVDAWIFGDWDVVEGAFFDCWDSRRHVLRPFAIPDDWTRFRSGDWGSAKPFSFGWWAVVGDKFKTTDGLLLPRGAIVRYREWYGVKKDKDGVTQPNVGLKMDADAVGKRLAEIEEEDQKLIGGVLDPAAFSEDGGPSIAQRINAELIKKKLVLFRSVDNKRVPGRGAMGGWDQLRGRLVGDEDNLPMIATFLTCVDSIRTLPLLQHDEGRPEDVDSDMEDHAPDEWRYACMSRPWVRKKPAEEKPANISGYKPMSPAVSANDVWKTF